MYYARLAPNQIGACRTRGAVAQLGERCVRNAEVEGSIPFRSTNSTSPNITQDPGNRAVTRFFHVWRPPGLLWTTLLLPQV